MCLEKAVKYKNVNEIDDVNTELTNGAKIEFRISISKKLRATN